MLIVSSPISVADTKIIFRHNFGASLNLIKDVNYFFKIGTSDFKEKHASAATIFLAIFFGNSVRS